MDVRPLISEADKIAREQGLTQAEWCRRAGFDEFGKLVSNTHRRGNCKLSVFAQLLRVLGYEIRIVRTENPPKAKKPEGGVLPGQMSINDFL